MLAMPFPSGFRTVPLRGATARQIAESWVEGFRNLEVFISINAFEIDDAIVAGVTIPVVNVTAVWNSAKRALPNSAVKQLAATCVIRVTRSRTIQATIEKLRNGVKHDWIDEFVCN
jgi:hypothetical protein